MDTNDAVVVLEDGKMSIRSQELARAFIDQYVKTLYPQIADLAIGKGDVPRIGDYWDGQGGIYAGTVRGENGAPDHHLILHKDEKDSIQWQPALDWAKTLVSEGHNDFSLPTRREQAILYGNLKDQFKPEWHWSCEQHASDPSCAWGTYFGYGYQGYVRKDDSYRARAVRRIVIQ